MVNIDATNYFIVKEESMNNSGERLPDGASLITQR